LRGRKVASAIPVRHQQDGTVCPHAPQTRCPACALCTYTHSLKRSNGHRRAAADATRRSAELRVVRAQPPPSRPASFHRFFPPFPASRRICAANFSRDRAINRLRTPRSTLAPLRDDFAGQRQVSLPTSKVEITVPLAASAMRFWTRADRTWKRSAPASRAQRRLP
jgi:hypothetical protein